MNREQQQQGSTHRSWPRTLQKLSRIQNHEVQGKEQRGLPTTCCCGLSKKRQHAVNISGCITWQSR